MAWIALPIFNEYDDARVAAILVARVNLEISLYDLLLNRTGMGETGETLIINQDMMALNELRWYQRAPLKLRMEAEPAMYANIMNWSSPLALSPICSQCSLPNLWRLH